MRSARSRSADRRIHAEALRDRDMSGTTSHAEPERHPGATETGLHFVGHDSAPSTSHAARTIGQYSRGGTSRRSLPGTGSRTRLHLTRPSGGHTYRRCASHTRARTWPPACRTAADRSKQSLVAHDALNPSSTGRRQSPLTDSAPIAARDSCGGPPMFLMRFV